MKKLTVFMPVYNTEKYLNKSIDSILNQNFKDFEFLIIDDGSNDNSVKIVESYNDKRIKLIKNNENKGLPYTRNLALKIARGEYFCIMDSDDIAKKNRLKKQVEFLDKYKDVDVVTSNEIVIYNKIPIKRTIRNINSEVLKFSLIFENSLGNTTTMFRKKSICNIIYDKNFFVCQDYNFWVDLMPTNKFANISENLMIYRTGHNNITKRSKTDKAEKRKYLISEIRKKALKFNNINLDNEKIIKLNYFLDNSNKELSKFNNIEYVMKDIINQCKKVSVCKESIKCTIENQLSICNGSVYNKVKILNNLSKELDISFKKSIVFNFINRSVYNSVRRIIVK